jgi:hypothetical protein
MTAKLGDPSKGLISDGVGGTMTPAEYWARLKKHEVTVTLEQAQQYQMEQGGKKK